MEVNLLHVVIARTWGGGEQYVYDNCKEMKKQGKECFVVVDESNEYFVERYSEVAKVYTANLYVLGGLLALRKIKKIIESLEISIINCHSGHALLTCLLLKKLTKVHVVMFKHNAVPLKKDAYHLWQLKNVDAYICVSKLVYDMQIENVPKRFMSKFHLVYNGIDVGKFNNNRERLNNETEVFKIGYAGRLAHNKGIDVLIKAFARYVKNHPNSILKIAGSDENGYKSKLQKLTTNLNVANSVVFCGHVKDMECFYRSIDIFVLPSLVRESFGLVICEAIYCGIPVITTDSGAQREILFNDDYGCIVKKGDVEELERALEDFFCKRRVIKQDGATFIYNKFSAEKCVKKLIEIYNMIITC